MFFVFNKKIPIANRHQEGLQTKNMRIVLNAVPELNTTEVGNNI